MVSLLLLAPMTPAAPTNDKFEDAEVLGPALPVQVDRENVGATEEPSGDPFLSFTAGHSVWFKWQATGTGFVTIGSCKSGFPATVAVFTGTEVSSLTSAASGNADEGPHCPNEGREYTFKALSGMTYAIMVDGNGFSFGAPPPTEGEFTLRIESTPVPANDAFQNAAALVGQALGEAGGEQIYRAAASGYNWGADKEAEEPEHGGDPGGASVWYSWTAPATGVARISACCGWAPMIGVYTGDVVDSLIPVAMGPGAPVNGTIMVTAGATYRIAVDGKRDTGTGEAETGGFSLSVFMQLPTQGSSGGAGEVSISSPPDKTPPNTTIRKRVLRSRPPQLIFHFSSNELGSTFRCKLDKHRFAKCQSPKRFSRLKPGSHTLKVFAVDPVGNADLSPAVARFTVPGEPKPHSRH